MSAVSYGIGSLLPGSDPDSLFDRHHEDLAVADLLRASGVLNGLHGPFDKGVIEHDLNFDLGQEVNHVLCSAIHLGVSLLPPEALDLGDGHAGDANLVQRILHIVELERLDDRFDLLHSLTISCRARGGLGFGSLAAFDCKWRAWLHHSSRGPRYTVLVIARPPRESRDRGPHARRRNRAEARS